MGYAPYTKGRMGAEGVPRASLKARNGGTPGPRPTSLKMSSTMPSLETACIRDDVRLDPTVRETNNQLL